MASPSATLEAVLFAAGEPLTKKRLCTLLGVTPDLLAAGLKELQASLQGHGLTLVETDEEVELRTSADTADIIKKLRESELSRDLGKAGLEALAVILYQDGATRSEIDWVRGVNSTAAIRSLLMRGLIARSEDVTDRRRARYTVTIDGLAHLGVSDKTTLPRYEEFNGALSQQREAQAAAETITAETP